MLGLVGGGLVGWLCGRRRRKRVFFNLFPPLPSLIFAGIRCVRACFKSSAGCGDSMSGFYDLYAREEEEDIQEERESDTCTQSVGGNSPTLRNSNANLCRQGNKQNVYEKARLKMWQNIVDFHLRRQMQVSPPSPLIPRE